MFAPYFLLILRQVRQRLPRKQNRVVRENHAEMSPHTNGDAIVCQLQADDLSGDSTGNDPAHKHLRPGAARVANPVEADSQAKSAARVTMDNTKKAHLKLELLQVGRRKEHSVPRWTAQPEGERHEKQQPWRWVANAHFVLRSPICQGKIIRGRDSDATPTTKYPGIIPSRRTAIVLAKRSLDRVLGR